MLFSRSQQARIQVEKNLLDKYFPRRVKWHTPDTDSPPHVEVRMVSNSNKNYTLRIYLSDDFPNSCPEMVLTSPRILKIKDGTPLPPISHEFHTIGEKEGFVLICHFTPSLWTAENTLYQVFMKGRLWIEGYEGHLSSGENMDVYLKSQDGLELMLESLHRDVAQNTTSTRSLETESDKCTLL